MKEKPKEKPVVKTIKPTTQEDIDEQIIYYDK